MKGYIAQRRGRFYVVIYEGTDPATGKEQRSWHPAGTDRAEAERLAAKLTAAKTRRNDGLRSLTFGDYLTDQWLPAKKLQLATSTYKGYERNVTRHILPALGRTRLRQLRFQQIEALYDHLLHPVQGKGLSPKTVYEIHLLIRGALADALRRGLVTRNVALLARAPKQRSLQKVEGKAWTDEQLRRFLRTAAAHRFFPILWLTAMTGMRRNEVLGLKWPDIDFKKRRLALNRGLVAVGYELHQTRGKTKTARRSIDLDDTTLTALEAWRGFQTAEFAAVGITNGLSSVANHTLSCAALAHEIACATRSRRMMWITCRSGNTAASSSAVDSPWNRDSACSRRVTHGRLFHISLMPNITVVGGTKAVDEFHELLAGRDTVRAEAEYEAGRLADT